MLRDLPSVSLDCGSNSLALTSKSIKLFGGQVRSKRNNHVLCEHRIPEGYGFRVELAFDECAMERESHPSPSYSGLLMVKEGSSEFITRADKMIQVNCRLHQRAERHPLPVGPVGLRFELEQGNSTHHPSSGGETFPQPVPLHDPSPGPPTPALIPSYRLEVLDAGGRLADTVDVNDFGYLQISATYPTTSPNSPHHPPPPEDFTISELVAENLSTNEYIQLIDARGCVSNYALVKSLEKPGPGRMRIGILFSGFGTRAKVTYQALVKPCTYDCVQECNRQLYEHRGDNGPHTAPTRPSRSIRAVVWNDEALPAMRLHGDVYFVRSGTVSQAAVGVVDGGEGGEVQRMELQSDFYRCLHDGNCFLTLLSMSVQVIAVLLCACMLYSYLKVGEG